MIRLAWAVDRLVEVTQCVLEMRHAAEAGREVSVLLAEGSHRAEEILREVIDELRGERAEYAAELNDDLFGERGEK